MFGGLFGRKKKEKKLRCPYCKSERVSIDAKMGKVGGSDVKICLDCRRRWY
jgi:hypothetical protein